MRTIFFHAIGLSIHNARFSGLAAKQKVSLKRVFIPVCIVLFLAVSSASASLITLNFSSLFGGGDTGTSLTFDGLTVTAKTMATTTQIPFLLGTAADVYWGNLGTLGTTATTIPPTPASGSYFGLGVGDSMTGPITFKETLVFSFTKPQDPKNTLLYGTMTSATDLSFRLLGTNQLASGGTGAPADSIRVFLKVASGETPSFDVNAGALSPAGAGYPSPDALDWSYWIRWALNQYNYADEHIVALAIEQVYGSATNPNRQFGLGSLTYETPEPATMGLLAMGGLWIMRRRSSVKTA